MPPITRRAFLTGATLTGITASALVLAGCAPTTPTPSPSPTHTGPTSWTALGAAVTGTLLRPDSGDYATARLTENPRFDDAMPLGILQAASALDVAAGLAFARNTGTPLAVRAGGHNYAGWSAGGATGTDVKPSLVISTAALDGIALAADGTTATIGPGAPLALVYETLGAKGRAIGAGSCGTVAIGGLTLGGGVGVLSRSFGLTCDQLTGVEIVTADGVVHDASASSDTDLFWACRGGGGGSVGIVTSMTFTTQPAPDITMFFVQWPWTDALQVVSAWQNWMPGADDRVWSTLKLLAGSDHTAGPIVALSGTWTGPEGDFAAQLAGLLQNVSAAPLANTATRHTYSDAMLRYAGCAGEPASACTTGPGGVLKRVSESAASAMAYDDLDSAAIAALLAQVSGASGVAGLTEGGISLDALGGAVAKIGPADTAFPHRKARYTVQYTATFANGAATVPFDGYVRGFRKTMSSSWGEGAYVNYTDPSLTAPGTSYFAGNLARLRSIKKKVDPTTLFHQPHFL
ncbi:MAG: FAD-binding protein [Frondihabitans sp.]|nr:FAD-binding protein [Frondihabitans sp.]